MIVFLVLGHQGFLTGRVIDQPILPFTGLAVVTDRRIERRIATKAAIHSYTQSLRYKLGQSSVRVLEIAPPWVQTDLLNSRNEPRAMPLDQFIAETMEVLGTDAEEVLVERVKPLRNNPGPGEAAFVKQFNDMLNAH